MRQRLIYWVLAMTWVMVAALPASANLIKDASVTDTCSGYTINVAGVDLTKPTTVNYTITLTPTSGSPINVSDSIPVTPVPHTHTFSGTNTQTWAHYSVTLTGDYTLKGTATLVEPNNPKFDTIKITFSPTTLDCKIVPPPGSCLPSSSLGVLVQGTNVNTYVPNGAWDTSSTGLSVVPVEGTGTPGTIGTPNTVNSCASNPNTGVTVCTSNVNDVYLISGSTLNSTISSGGTEYTGFSGGSCITCGVAMNATANAAVATIGLSSAPSGSGLQFLDLATSTFGTPVPLSYEVSEDVLWDQGRNLVLSPNEAGVYDIYNTSSGVEFGNPVGGELDSAAEECSTGIALATDEFTSNLFIADLTQATFTPGTPGSWTTTAEQFQTFPEFGAFAAGTDGIAIAQGSHLGIATGEFGGNWLGVIQLPSTSGSGTPAVLNYAAVALPNTPDNNAFEQGLDPHTVTAYVSPNSGDAIGLMANGFFTPPTWLAVIDLTKLLAAPRTVGTHYVDPSVNLETSGILTYVAVP